MSATPSVKINWSAFDFTKPHPLGEMMQKLGNKHRDFLATLEPSSGSAGQLDECTYVYHGCGSCGEGLALVEAFCNSTGGSEPDYSWCEAC